MLGRSFGTNVQLFHLKGDFFDDGDGHERFQTGLCEVDFDGATLNCANFDEWLVDVGVDRLGNLAKHKKVGLGEMGGDLARQLRWQPCA